MKIYFGKGEKPVYINSNKINRHGIICGATGTGKTVTLKVLAEKFSNLGIPVVLTDIKGDLTNICKAGKMNNKIEERLNELGISDFKFENFPVNLWDVFSEKGIPLRVSISEMGPHLLSQILDLNETQRGVLSIAFRVADEEGLLLIDIKDLRAILNFLSENRKKYSAIYGNIAPQSISSIQRKILLLEEDGAEDFFFEPSININDFLQKDSEEKGYINIISCDKLIRKPTIYSMFLLYLISELFENLPEVGDLELPKIVFFFDEAHLLFNNLPKYLEEKILQTIRLIRSKGVGIFFISQNPTDIPDDILSQLGNKIIHQLRAFSPKELKSIKAISQNFRENPNINIEKEIVNLRTGEALVSVLEDDGTPTITEKTYIYPPKSSFDLLSEEDYNYLIKNSLLIDKYKEPVDRESAYEKLQRKILDEKAFEEKPLPKKNKKSMIDKSIDSFFGTMSRSIGREIARNVLGSIKKF